MGYISKINVDGTMHEVKDAEARKAADNAAAAANNKISKNGGEEEATTVVNFQNGIKLGNIPINYNASNNTITFG